MGPKAQSSLATHHSLPWADFLSPRTSGLRAALLDVVLLSGRWLAGNLVLGCCCCEAAFHAINTLDWFLRCVNCVAGMWHRKARSGRGLQVCALNRALSAAYSRG